MKTWRLPKTYSFEGHTVRYGVRGDGPAIVLVHGTPWSSYNLRHLIDALSKHFAVHFYDLLDYGQSDKPSGDISLGVQNRLLDALIGYWRLESPMVVGHDFGGSTVLRAHFINQRDFERIVLIDPVALSPWGSPFFKHVNKHEQAFAGVPDYIHEAIVRAYVQSAAHNLIGDEVLDNIVSPWTGTGGKAAFYRQIAQADSRYTDEVQPLYEQISRPVLILWGREDSWIPAERGRLLHETIPDSQFCTIPDVGHLVIEEQPEQLLAHIVPFVRGNGGK